RRGPLPPVRASRALQGTRRPRCLPRERSGFRTPRRSIQHLEPCRNVTPMLVKRNRPTAVQPREGYRAHRAPRPLNREPDMKLYTFDPSPNARKVAAVVAHLRPKDIEVELVRLHKGEHRQPGYLAINPMGKVPALR